MLLDRVTLEDIEVNLKAEETGGKLSKCQRDFY